MLEIVKDLIFIVYFVCVAVFAYKFGYTQGKKDEQINTYEEMLNVLADKDVIEVKDGIEALNKK